VVVINESGKIAYTQLVPEITQDPDFEAVLKYIKSLRA
jgi:thiol peroxidase